MTEILDSAYDDDVYAETINSQYQFIKECEGRTEISVPRITFCHHKACGVMKNGDHEG